jgi:hypothetical protein
LNPLPLKAPAVNLAKAIGGVAKITAKKIMRGIAMLKRGKSVKLFILTMFLLIGLLPLSCYKDYGMETKDYDLVAAFYDKTTDFAAYQTYMIPDSIHHIVEEGKEDRISRKFDPMILDQIDVNMRTLGYTKIERPSENAKPDILMVVAATSKEHYDAWVIYPWYPYYPWYPGWGTYPPGWYYPWYPVYGVSGYSTGSVLMSMVDTDQYDAEKQAYKAVWAGAVNGLLDDTESNISKRLTTAINEAFRISPYLGTE